MRFLRLAGNGFGTFRSAFEVDFHSIAGELIAVCGPNGAGKSTLLELLGAAMYRECPTRGALVGLATTREAWLELDVEVGDRVYRLRHAADAVSRKSEATVVDVATGASLVESGKVRAYDEWVERHLPPSEVFYSSMFSAQGDGGFLSLAPGPRKAVLLRVLGVDGLEQRAERARERLREAKAELKTQEARVADERARGLDVAEASDYVLRAKAELAAVEEERATVAACLEQLRREAADAKVKQAEAQALEERRRDVAARRDAASRRAADLAERIRNNADLIDRAAVIRAAAARRAELELRLAELNATAKANADFRKEIDARIAAAEQRCRRLEARAAELQTSLEGRAEIEAASPDKARAALVDAERITAECVTRLEVTQTLQLDGADLRIASLRTCLEKIRTGVDDPSGFAAMSLAADDCSAAEQARAPQAVRAAQLDLNDAKARLESARGALQRHVELAALKPAIVATEAELARLVAEHKLATAEISEAAALRDEAEKKGGSLDEFVAMADEHKALAADAARLEKLASAEARLAELQPQLDEAVADARRLAAEHLSLPEPQPIAFPDVAAKERGLSAVDSAVRVARENLTKAEGRLETARSSAERLADMLVGLDVCQKRVAACTLVAETLGRDGLQAYEIDAAGPEISQLATDLLHEAFGSRWTVTLETTRLAADGRTLEDCEVRVLDTEAGTDGPADRLSGGEKVIVSEALSLALTVLACRRAGFASPTVIRDESGAALDPVRARAHVAMLRRARQLIGASSVLLVSHSPDVVAMTDARVRVEEGTVRVEA